MTCTCNDNQGRGPCKIHPREEEPMSKSESLWVGAGIILGLVSFVLIVVNAMAALLKWVG